MNSTFDPLIEFDVRSAKHADDLIEKIGERAKFNGPRTGEGRRTSQSSEAYCMRRWLLHMAQADLLKYPVSVFHLDAPDFIVVENGVSYGIEVTEATVVEDGREWARSEKSEQDVELLGTHGGRGSEGFMGDAPLRMVFQDITDAINRKSGKYPADAIVDLLIYPNSNPAFVFSRKRDLPRLLQMKLDRKEFRRLFLLWDDGRIDSV